MNAHIRVQSADPVAIGSRSRFDSEKSKGRTTRLGASVLVISWLVLTPVGIALFAWVLSHIVYL